MPRPLGYLSLVATVLLAVLAGCASQPPAPIEQLPPPVTTARSPVQKWLDWQAGVTALEASQVSSGLEAMSGRSTADERFYYALLNQRAQNYDAWVIARDIYRRLGQDQTLPPEQRQLAGILEQYVQQKINGYQRYEQLQQQYQQLQQQHEETRRQVVELQEQNQLLENKIKAITDLEATISERKEN